MNHEGRSPDNAQEEQEWLASLSRCVGSLHSFLAMRRSLQVSYLSYLSIDKWGFRKV